MKPNQGSAEDRKETLQDYSRSKAVLSLSKTPDTKTHACYSSKCFIISMTMSESANVLTLDNTDPLSRLLCFFGSRTNCCFQLLHAMLTMKHL